MTQYYTIQKDGKLYVIINNKISWVSNKNIAYVFSNLTQAENIAKELGGRIYRMWGELL